MTDASPQKPYISPPLSPQTDEFESGSNSPVNSPSPTAMSRSNSGLSLNSESGKRLSLGFTSAQARRRGYVRPQGTEFSKSAKNRNSVMALGSIAHVQHFFAKTGLLEGKGGGYKKKLKKEFDPVAQMRADTALIDSTYSSLRSSPELLLPHEQPIFDGGIISSPIDFVPSPISQTGHDDENDDVDDDPNAVLPPTMSTYKPTTPTLPPAPERETLKEDLREALDGCRRNWIEAASLDYGAITSVTPNEGPKLIIEESYDSDTVDTSDDDSKGPVAGFKDVLVHTLLSSTTVAVRAAREYYYSIGLKNIATLTSEKKLREDFLNVLDILKRVSLKEGDVRPSEKDGVLSWIETIESLLDKEERTEDESRRAGQVWLTGDWKGKEWERYYLFLSYFDAYISESSLSSIPRHDIGNAVGSPMMKALQDGQRLILLHNAIVRRSRRPFGQIPQYHTDFKKPYRMAENLRYWLKAAEIRWDTKLSMEVIDTVYGREEGMNSFEKAIQQWCERLIREVRREWEEDSKQQTLLGIAEKKERRRSRRMNSGDSY